MAHTTAVRKSVADMRYVARNERIAALREGRKNRAITIAGKKGKGGYSRRPKHRGLADS